MAVFPVDEAARIAALNRYAILDTPPEQKFDRITRMVSDICEAPIALISLIDSERQWFKSHLGMDATETPRDIAFCDHTIREDNLFIVPDASADLWPFGALPARRFRKNWWSRGGSNSRPSHCERDALPAELRPHSTFPLGKYIKCGIILS